MPDGAFLEHVTAEPGVAYVPSDNEGSLEEAPCPRPVLLLDAEVAQQGQRECVFRLLTELEV